MNLRLIKAESLLEDSSLPVSQAAAQAGFYSLKTFYRFFYEKHGASPGDFRKARSQSREAADRGKHEPAAVRGRDLLRETEL